MSPLDYLVLFGTLLGIAFYGFWKTRRGGTLNQYLKGDANTRWPEIGLSVMATQASAITFLSMPGQAYENGVGFVQNYFGLPLALIVVCAFFIPAYQRLRVFTAYEYLGQRFDRKTRLLGAGLFLIQRGLATGITILAPAIILSALLGWNLNLTICLAGGLVVLYTTTGGARAVNLTQRWQLSVALLGMCAALGIVVAKLPNGVSFGEAVAVAGKMGKLSAVDFSLSPDRRYTVWSGLLGGFFLALSYFGADQTQVGRYLAGESETNSRFGLLFNAILKVPMQCFILFIGALVFVFYQFEKPPIFFDAPALPLATPAAAEAMEPAQKIYDAVWAEKQAAVFGLVQGMKTGNANAVRSAQDAALRLDSQLRDARDTARKQLAGATSRKSGTKDSDFIFLTFILRYLPHGLVGLLVAVIFCAAMSAAAAGLNALASTTVVDFYRPLLQPEATDAHYVLVSRLLTAAWGAVAVGFALFARMVENLIEAGNILGSLFYGSILGLFLTAFFLRFVRGSAVFAGALLAQMSVLVLYATTNIGYLWFNLIGCAGVLGWSALLQCSVFRTTEPPRDLS